MNNATRTQPRRIVLTIPGEAFVELQARAQREMRPTKAEALKLLLDGLHRDAVTTQ